jgi:hypothetical protein
VPTGARAGHGAIHIAALAIGNGGQQLACGRVDDVDRAALLRLFPAAIDEQLAGVQLWFDLSDAVIISLYSYGRFPVCASARLRSAVLGVGPSAVSQG